MRFTTAHCILILLLILFTGISMDNAARRDAEKMLSEQGYTDVVLGDWRTAPYRFTATSPEGKKVTGHVVGGYNRGHMLEFDK
jgi:hypothetical protein